MGRPPTAAQAQSLLYASLATSLFSVIRRSRNRQRKLDDMVAWYFDHLMESLPLMLRAALLLLGYTLIPLGDQPAVASVAPGVNSFVLTFYIFVVVAGAASGLPVSNTWTPRPSLSHFSCPSSRFSL
jgi:hypothetical protein